MRIVWNAVSFLCMLAFVALLGQAANAETYSYDALGRLATVSTDDGKLITYSYDAAGNRTQVSTALSTVPTVESTELAVNYNTPGSKSVKITGVYTRTNIATPATKGTATISGATVSYTPSSGYIGADNFTFTATGPGGTSLPAAVAVTVRAPVEAAPVAPSASLIVNYNTAGSTTVIIKGTFTSTAIVTAATKGTASTEGNVIRYTPTSGYVGTDSFTYKAIGPGGSSAAATVSVTVNAPAAPVAPNANLFVGYNTAGSTTVSITGVYTKTEIATPATKGAASINGATIAYTPSNGSSGADSFTYKVTGPGGTSTATVSVVVAYPEGAVLLRVGAQTGGASTWSYTVPVGVSAIDVELWGAGGNSGSAAQGSGGNGGGPASAGSGAAYARKHLTVSAGQVLSGLLAIGGTNGASTLSTPAVVAGGGLTGPQSAGGTASGGDVNIAGFAGSGRRFGGGAGYGAGDQTQGFGNGTYPGGGASDGTGSGGQVIVTVRAQLWSPAAPTVQNITVPYANGGSGTVTLSGSGNYSAFEIISPPNSGYAQASGANQVTYNIPSGGTFTYVATGPGGNSVPATVTIGAPPPAPPVANPGSILVGFGGSGSAGLLISGTYTSTAIASQPAHGSASISGATAYYTAASGYYGSDSFTYTATGPGGTTAPATVSVTVQSPAPTVADLRILVDYNSAYYGSLSISGPYSSTAIASGASHGTAFISGLASNEFGYIPASGYSGTDSFTYTATGPGGTSAPATVFVTVQAPPLPPPPTANDKTMIVDYQSTGSAPVDISGQWSSTAIAAGPAYGSASISGSTVNYSAAPGYSGPDSFTYTATGPGGTSAPAAVSVTVRGPPPATLAASLSASDWSWFKDANNKPTVSNSIIVSVAGGSGSYNISWTRISGDGNTQVKASGNGAYWSRSPSLADNIAYLSTWRCTVSDSSGQSVIAGDVNVSWERDNFN